ncbi:MAG: glutamate--tRNA ligase [Dehalococcoidia bacterium]|nr:glutamate--tRNA ligase [Dehalococcoidia bacterium]
MNKNRPVRVRYAPSPTGFPHIGNIRTALFNWLFARHTGGTFILRIEDTDQERKVEGALEAIMSSLRWLGLDWDEGPEVGGKYGPYFQSQRLPFYQDIAQQLVLQGNAYYCFCSSQRLDEMREEQRSQGKPTGYDRNCRNLSLEEQSFMDSQGLTPVVRFKTPVAGQTRFNDLIWGDVSFENATLDDFILLKSDGFPTYHLANICDDHRMEISHVMRAEEWLSSTPKHCLLYKALGWEPPEFAHLPMILGPDRSKLSKRHGATGLLEYKDMGYLQETIINFLALLGWALDDRTELFSREELVKQFSLDKISKTAAIFNQEKLNWMNGVYIRQLSPADLAERAMPVLEQSLPSSMNRPLDKKYLLKLIPLVQERARTLKEVPELAEFFYIDNLVYDPKLLMGKHLTSEQARSYLDISVKKLTAMPDFEPATLENLLRPLSEELGVKTGDFFGLLRTATTGRTAAPPLFQTMSVLGKERCLKRINDAIKIL